MSTLALSPSTKLKRSMPNSPSKENDDVSEVKHEKRYVSGPMSATESLLSPSKRELLKQMSPNVLKKSKPLSESIIKPPHYVTESKFQRPQLPSSLKPKLEQRSKTSLTLPSTNVPPSFRRSNSLLHRSNSSLADAQQSSINLPDRFIPSRHNSVSGKLDSSTASPAPNASPETHIKAQTSKIYQHHVAEACGLEVNSRILLYQPPPPERKSLLILRLTYHNQASLKLGNTHFHHQLHQRERKRSLLLQRESWMHLDWLTIFI